MACKTICQACPNLVISSAVTFDSTDNVLTITIPNQGYFNGEKVCIFVAQEIPDTTTITSTVVIGIEGSTSTFPLLNCDCQPLTSCAIRYRTRYSTKVVTNISSGVFRLLGKACPVAPSDLTSLPIEGGTT